MLLTERQALNFWRKVSVGKEYECWNWCGAIVKGGYGIFGFNRKLMMTHRLSWILKNGEIPLGNSYHGVCVLHRCDNRKCVNPGHLFLGTHSDNMLDMYAKNRQPKRLTQPMVGSMNGSAKLNEEKVSAIRKLRLSGKSLNEIAISYGVTGSNVSSICHNRIWKHV